jgi:hypothetical protein
MKKILIFFLILLIFIFLFDNKILSYLFSKKISNLTKYNSKINVSKVNYFKGELEIDKIKIKNTKNIESDVFEADSIFIDFDFQSLVSNLIIINQVIIIDPVFYFDIKIQNNNTKLNKENVINNMNITDNSKKIYPSKKRDKNFLISNLSIKNSKAIIKYKKNIKDLNINLSNITFSNVGNAGKEIDNNFQHYKDVFRFILSDIFFKLPNYELRELIKKNYKIR